MIGFNIQQDRHCGYDVTLRRLRTTIVIVEKQQWLHIQSGVCSNRYPACNVHGPYCHLWPVRTYNIFPTLPYKWHDIKKKVTEYKTCVLIFSIIFAWNISHSMKKRARYNHKCILVLIVKYRYSCQMWMKHDFFFPPTDFRKNAQIWNFMKIRPVVAELFSGDGRMDRRTRTWRS